MKILRIIDSFYPFISGPSNEAFHFSHELEKKNIHSPIFTSYLDVTNVPKEEYIDGVYIRRFKIKIKIMRFAYTPYMKKYLKNEDCDIIHAHNYRSYQSHIGYRIAQKKNIPFIINPCGGLLGYRAYLSGIKTFPYKFYDFFTNRKIILNASKVIVESEVEYQEALKFGVEEKNIALIPMGIDFNRYKNENKEFQPINSEKPLKLLFVGRIARNRNLAPIIEAMKNLKDVVFWVVGEESYISQGLKGGYMNELRALVQKHNLQEKIHFLGPKYGEELINIYKKADCFIYTSRSENFGQTIQEAAASGLPLICTKIGIAKDIIENNITGFFVKHDNPLDIIDKVNLLKSFERRKMISHKIQEIIKMNYNWDHIIRQYINVYNEFL